MIPLLPVGARAATWTWNVTSGNWSTAGNWNPATAPGTTASDVLNLTNGISGTPATTSFDVTSGVGAVNIGLFNTLTLNAGTTATATAALTNHGVFQTSGAAQYTLTGTSNVNDGTIQANSGGTLTLVATAVTNTGGLIQAKTGGGVVFSTTGGTITNGTLKTESGGTASVRGINMTQTLNGVTVNNQGAFESYATGTNASGSTFNTTLGSGTAFTNASGATTVVDNRISGSGTGSNKSSFFNVNTGATFTNAGTLTVQNQAVRTGSIATQATTFSVASTATFTNTGTVEVVALSTGVGASAAFTSAKAITNQGVVRVQGNANNTAASFTVTGNSYTQSGAGAQRTVLEQGGTISADTLAINAGSLGGAGTVTGATTIGAGATLIAGDTYAGTVGAGILAFNNDLMLGNNANFKFGLGTNTASSGQVTLAGASNLALGTGLTLTLTDLTGGSWISGTTYRLFDLASGSITGTALSGIALSMPSGWTGTLSSGAGGTDYVDFTLATTAGVPEPSVFALIAGSFALIAACRRRR